ncbi:MAG: hypothetical protein LBT54_01415 [Bifidobacteriaceae bacterium]|jgi:hypothetical protein|nr:hypothetical protein [Bifidobacteriaceae bacterium]
MSSPATTGNLYAGLAVPERTRLFHIGIPKTGTTFIQRAATACRDRLAENGVFYPPAAGTAHNHRDPIHAALGRGFSGLPAPRPEVWDAFRGVIEADTENRVLFGYESAAGASEEQVRFFADQLGPSLHAVVTLRPYGVLLPSVWQESAKLRSGRSFEDFLRVTIDQLPDRGLSQSFFDRNDQGLVVRRWAGVLGAERVHVVIADKANPDHLAHAFEGLLDLPRDLLVGRVDASSHANRSLTLDEAELLRRVAQELRKDLEPAEYIKLMRGGAVVGMARSQRDRSADRRLALPDWAAARATERGRRFADQIEQSGVRVIGDLDLLRAEIAGVDPSELEMGPLPLDLAVETVANVARRAAEVWRAEEARTKRAMARTVSKTRGRTLARELARRIRRRVAGRPTQRPSQRPTRRAS